MIQKKISSISYAMKGIRIAYLEEANFQMHLAITVVVVIAGLYFSLTNIEWLYIVFAIGFVLTSELFNTALEELCDMLRTSHDPHVAKIKDLAAGAVFLASVTALIIGLMIFVPKILAL